MKKFIELTACALMMLLTTGPAHGQKKSAPELFARENLVAWCVVPFDKMKRTPEQRALMLKDLGITQLAWDWRQEHLPEMTAEIHALRKHNIRLKAVWFWVNGTDGNVLDEANNYILKTLADNNIRTELWLSFNERFFAGLTDSEKLGKATRAIGLIHEKVTAIGCTLHLYNHGNWFGEPANQVNIIRALNAPDIGIVYNFHHARHHVTDFPDLVRLMKPYLSTVNINGMRDGGPMILPLGEGQHEMVMLQQLKKSGYRGAIGILSHVDDEDAKVVLARNLQGLQALLEKMKEDKALKSY